MAGCQAMGKKQLIAQHHWQPSQLSAVFLSLQMNSTMQRTPTANRSMLILTSGIISAVLSAVLFCFAFFVL